MLPGFRFLFGAIVLSVSVLVFGVGAAALLRAAHEEFASNPTWRAPTEPMFAQREATRPMLAVLQVNPQSSAGPPPTGGPAGSVNAPAADLSAPNGPDRPALARPQQGSSPDSRKPETPAVESSKAVDTAAPPAWVAAIPSDTNVAMPADSTADSTATSASRQEPVLGQAANEPIEIAGAQTAEPASSAAGPDAPSTSLAALGDEPVAPTNTPAAQAPTRAPNANAETEAKKRARAEREKERRRAAQRARLLALQAAAQEPGAAQQALSPQLFGAFPPLVQPTAATGQPAAPTTTPRKR